eukprot:TRINITY_DN16443_c0_g1_i1.p1 TRINITY_DN16443_c0_g1~~TRINITY_DN16443_c0_g1_i1.p1  ORF type:complete len:515 (+),score=101.96 TRINITY_DN16443_c0_g1_i1:104-1648(+)
MKLVKYVTLLIAICTVVVTLNVGAVQKSNVRDAPIRARPNASSRVVEPPKETLELLPAPTESDVKPKVKKKSAAGGSKPVKHLSDLHTGDYITITSRKSKRSLRIPYGNTTDPSLAVFEVLQYETHSVKGFGFKSRHGTYITTESDRKLTVDRYKAKGMEHFQIEFPHELEGDCVIRCTKTRQLLVVIDKGFRTVTASLDEVGTKDMVFHIAKIDCNNQPSMCAPGLQLKIRDKNQWTSIGGVVACASPKPTKTEADNHKQTLAYQSWERLPFISWLIISEEDPVLRAATSHSFETDDSPELHPRFKQPTYRGLFSHALQSSPESKYVMYTNGDIMYSYSLPETLNSVLKWMEVTHPGKHIFIVGQRINVDMPDGWDIGDEDSDWSSNVENLEGSVYQADAEDYFIISRGLFKWDTIPDFVVGGVAFDNWIVSKAMHTSAVTVDASKTISAVHQNHGDKSCGTKCSHQSEKSKYNLQLAKKNGGTARGRTVDCKYVTVRTSNGIEIVEREKLYL